jgi:hypothetical protein
MASSLKSRCHITRNPLSLEAMDMEKIDNTFVTRRLLELTKQELQGDITSLRLEVRQYREESKSDHAQLKTEMALMHQELKTDITKVMVMLEEQNHNWKMALDGYGLIYHRQDDHEARITKLES